MGIFKDNLRSQVNAVCEESGFVDKKDVFFRGALAAQNPTKESWPAISKLTEEDRYWLEREETQRWDLPRGIYYTITLCSLGSAIQG